MLTVFRYGEFRKHIHVSSPKGETKTAEIQNISPLGFWIFDGETEFFVSFKDYPLIYKA